MMRASQLRLLMTASAICLAASAAAPVAIAALKGTPATKDPNQVDTPIELLPPPAKPEPKPKESEGDRRKRERTMRKRAPLLPPGPEVACDGEIEEFCKDLEGHALHSCLAASFRKLSRPCGMMFRHYLQARMKASCSADARVLCLGAERSKGDECLLTRAADVSVPCRSAIELWPAALGNKRAEKSK